MQVATASNSSPSKYFDLHCTALGYLDNIRVVPVNKGKSSFLACRFNAFRLDEHATTEILEVTKVTTRFDLTVVGAHAKACIEQLRAYTDANQAVLVQIKIGDIRPEMFTFKSGNRQGEMGCNIKGRVLKVFSAQVDGKEIELPPLPLPADVAEQEQRDTPPLGLLVKGAGYLNALRKVSLGEGDFCWKASISALRGDSVRAEDGKSQIETTRFDLVIAPDLIDNALLLQDSLLAKKKVLVGFRAGKINAELFTYQKGAKQGQTDAVIKGVLSGLDWAKVDGAAVTLTRLQEAA